jgi:hypothetical protein
MTRAERILEARRKLDAGEFDRAVTASEPYNICSNQLTLECGHWSVWILGVHESDETPARQKCHECAMAWVDAEPENKKGDSEPPS